MHILSPALTQYATEECPGLRFHEPGQGARFRLAKWSRHLGLPCPGCITFLAMAETQLDRVLDLLARLGAPYIVRSEEAFSQAILNSLVL